MLLSGIVFTAISGNEPGLFKEISRKTIIDLSRIELNDQVHYADVYFKVSEKKIRIYHITASQKELKRFVKERLETMIIKSDYDREKIYRYRFLFEKE